jgi:hypothetical protein
LPKKNSAIEAENLFGKNKGNYKKHCNHKSVLSAFWSIFKICDDHSCRSKGGVPEVIGKTITPIKQLFHQ